MDEANVTHHKALLREIKYVINKKIYCCHMKTEVNVNEPWELCVYSDTEYSEDKDTRKFLTG